MKFLLTFLIATIGFGTLYAQTDEESINQTVNDFLEGGTNGEVERFKRAFFNDAVQRAIGSKGVMSMTVDNLASKITPNQKMNRTTKILSVSYINNAAVAITETVYSTNKIIDMLNLLKIGNDWKIVSRVYSRVELDEDLNTVGVSGPAKPSTLATKPKEKPAPKKKPVSDDGW